jgi:hypothetical protein
MYEFIDTAGEGDGIDKEENREAEITNTIESCNDIEI